MNTLYIRPSKHSVLNYMKSHIEPYNLTKFLSECGVDELFDLLNNFVPTVSAAQAGEMINAIFDNLEVKMEPEAYRILEG